MAEKITFVSPGYDFRTTIIELEVDIENNRSKVRTSIHCRPRGTWGFENSRESKTTAYLNTEGTQRDTTSVPVGSSWVFMASREEWIEHNEDGTGTVSGGFKFSRSSGAPSYVPVNTDKPNELVLTLTKIDRAVVSIQTENQIKRGHIFVQTNSAIKKTKAIWVMVNGQVVRGGK